MGIEVTGFEEITDSLDDMIRVANLLETKPYTIEELEVMYDNAKGECAKGLIKALIEEVKEQLELQ